MSNHTQFATYPATENLSNLFHYSQVVRVGTTIKTSGQGGWDDSGEIVLDTKKQITLAFQNVEKSLKAIDPRLSWNNVYSLRSYHVNIEETFDITTDHLRLFSPEVRPIWTCVQVSKLGVAGMVIEMEVEAHYPF